jgi:hypothetical protein
VAGSVVRPDPQLPGIGRAGRALVRCWVTRLVQAEFGATG